MEEDGPIYYTPEMKEADRFIREVIVGCVVLIAAVSLVCWLAPHVANLPRL